APRQEWAATTCSSDIEPRQLPHPAIIIPNVLQFGMLIARIDDPKRSLIAGQQRLPVHAVCDNHIEAFKLTDLEIDDVVVKGYRCHRVTGRADMRQQIAHQEPLEATHAVSDRR